MHSENDVLTAAGLVALRRKSLDFARLLPSTRNNVAPFAEGGSSRFNRLGPPSSHAIMAVQPIQRLCSRTTRRRARLSDWPWIEWNQRISQSPAIRPGFLSSTRHVEYELKNI